MPARRRAAAIAATVSLQHARREARATGVGRADDAGDRVGEQHRQAVGRRARRAATPGSAVTSASASGAPSAIQLRRSRRGVVDDRHSGAVHLLERSAPVRVPSWSASRCRLAQTRSRVVLDVQPPRFSEAQAAC